MALAQRLLPAPWTPSSSTPRGGGQPRLLALRRHPREASRQPALQPVQAADRAEVGRRLDELQQAVGVQRTALLGDGAVDALDREPPVVADDVVDDAPHVPPREPAQVLDERVVVRTLEADLDRVLAVGLVEFPPDEGRQLGLAGARYREGRGVGGDHLGQRSAVVHHYERGLLRRQGVEQVAKAPQRALVAEVADEVERDEHAGLVPQLPIGESGGGVGCVLNGRGSLQEALADARVGIPDPYRHVEVPDALAKQRQGVALLVGADGDAGGFRPDEGLQVLLISHALRSFLYVRDSGGCFPFAPGPCALGHTNAM